MLRFWVAAQILASLTLFSDFSSAFPEMIRHQYQSCATCHYSPSGGGVLTPYGRSLSKELMSTWGREGEERIFYKKEAGEHWDLGGDVRFLQLYTNDETKEAARFFPMQVDLEPVFKWGKWLFAATLGAHRKRLSGNERKTEFLSRRHYLMYQATELTQLRIGRFFPQFGILSPDHNRLSRKSLGFDYGQETLNLEYSRLGAHTEIFLTGVLEQYRNNEHSERKGFVASAAVLFDSYKVGVSGYHLTDSIEEKTASSAWGALGFRENLFLLSEFNHIRIQPKADLASTDSYITTQVLGYELFKGLISYGVFEWEEVKTSNGSRVSSVTGGGLQWFPRPHLEFKLEYQNRKTPQLPADWAFLMLHYFF